MHECSFRDYAGDEVFLVDKEKWNAFNMEFRSLLFIIWYSLQVCSAFQYFFSLFGIETGLLRKADKGFPVG